MTQIRVNEGSRGLFRKRYILGISTAISDDNPIEHEISQIKKEVLSWQKRRGARCHSLAIVLMATGDRHDAISECVRKLLEQDPDLVPFLTRLSIKVILADPNTKNVREFDFQWKGR